MNKLSELELVDKFIDSLSLKKIPYKKELPFEGTRIDLCYWNKKNIYGIEFKLSNFTKVLYQASRIKKLFNYIFICLPKKSINNEKIKICIDRNIGLIVYDDKKEKFSLINKPKREKIKINIIKYKIKDKKNYA